MRDVTLPFWVIEKTECDQSYCNEREDHIWSSGCGEFFYHESYCDESVIMTIYGFQFFFVTSVPGCRGYILIWHMGGICPYIGPSTPPRVFGGTKTEPLHFSVSPIPEPEFPSAYVVVFLCAMIRGGRYSCPFCWITTYTYLSWLLPVDIFAFKCSVCIISHLYKTEYVCGCLWWGSSIATYISMA